MSLFGKRPALYGRDTSTDQPIGLFVCFDCAATVTEVGKETHAVWHTSIEERLRALETAPPSAPVVINNPGTAYTSPWPHHTMNYMTSNTGTTGSLVNWQINPPTINNEDDNGGCDCDCGGACE